MKETHTPKIVDQALSHPIKYTLMLTKEVFALNKGLFLGVTAIIIFLTFLSALPIIGFAATILSGILMFAILFFVGKTFYQAHTMNEFVEEIRSATLSSVWSRYWNPAMGAYLGWVGIMLIFLIISGIIVNITGGADALLSATKSGDPMAMFAILPSIIIPLILFALIFYVSPLVIANLLKTDNFNDGFKAVFTLFDRDVWHRAFKGEYFKYMTLLGLVLIALMVVVSLVLSILMSLLTSISPSMSIAGMMIMVIMMMILQVVMNIFYAISSVIADRMTH